MATSPFRKALQLFGWCVAFALISAATVSAQNVNYSMGSGVAAPGGLTTLSISVSGGSHPAGLQWTLDYSSANVAGITITPGPVTTAASKTIQCVTSASSLTCLATGLNTNGIADGVIAQAAVQIVSHPAAVTTAVQLTEPVSASASGSGVPSSGSSGEVTITEPPPALQFVPITPCHVVDTRGASGALGSPSLVGGATRSFPVLSSSCNVPESAKAYALNVTVVPPRKLGSLTIWPTGQKQPVVSTLGSDGRVKAQAAIVPAGTNGAVSVYVTDATNLVLDIEGYFVSAPSPGALAFYPLPPCRIADTRSSTYGSLGPPALSTNQTRTFAILSSACRVPVWAQAYSLNFTAIPAGNLGHITVYPAGQPRPAVSTLDDLTGTTVANAAIVAAGSNGAIDVYATDITDVVIDINGYFALPGTGGLSLYNVAPCRVLDTRTPQGNPPFSSELDVNATGSTCGIPTTAEAYVFNATVFPPAPMSSLTLWPQGIAEPNVSTLSAKDAAVTANLAIVSTSNGSIAARPSNPTQLALDILGYFAP